MPVRNSGKLQRIRAYTLYGTIAALTLLVVSVMGAMQRAEKAVTYQNIVRVGYGCTGFIMPNNMVFSASHCLEAGDKVGDAIKVEFFDGLSKQFQIVAIGPVADYRDYLILRGDTRGITPFKANPAFPNKGDIYKSVGFGGGSPRQLEVLCRVVGEEEGYVALSATVIPGDSGGPVMDYYTGEVFGIIVRTMYPVPDGVAVPIGIALKAANGVLDAESIPRPRK